MGGNVRMSMKGRGGAAITAKAGRPGRSGPDTEPGRAAGRRGRASIPDRTAAALDAVAASGQPLTFEAAALEAGLRAHQLQHGVAALRREGRWRWGRVVPARNGAGRACGGVSDPAEVALRVALVRAESIAETRDRPHSLMRSHAPEPVPRTEAEAARIACRAMIREARRKGWLGKARRAS